MDRRGARGDGGHGRIIAIPPPNRRNAEIILSALRAYAVSWLPHCDAPSEKPVPLFSEAMLLGARKIRITKGSTSCRQLNPATVLVIGAGRESSSVCVSQDGVQTRISFRKYPTWPASRTKSKMRRQSPPSVKERTGRDVAPMESNAEEVPAMCEPDPQDRGGAVVNLALPNQDLPIMDALPSKRGVGLSRHPPIRAQGRSQVRISLAVGLSRPVPRTQA